MTGIFSSNGGVRLQCGAIIARTFDRAISRGYNGPILWLEAVLAETITPAIFEHLVELAALALNEKEAAYLRRELNGQLKAIRELESIEIAGDVTITSHGVPYSEAISAPLRTDIIDPCKEADDILKQAPDVEDRLFVVPDILHEELE
ncbi:MAG: Asp-tRNA(Asn)/Glu-tRNA(Gln) amidotransferase subunit GatC [Anaerolineales bacterium]